jgi:DNA polymerase delta subunit 1
MLSKGSRYASFFSDVDPIGSEVKDAEKSSAPAEELFSAPFETEKEPFLLDNGESQDWENDFDLSDSSSNADSSDAAELDDETEPTDVMYDYPDFDEAEEEEDDYNQTVVGHWMLEAPNSILNKEHAVNYVGGWQRPTPVTVDPLEDDFVFQHVSTTQGIDPKRGPEIRIWGCTSAGNSVLVRVPDFKPYFYAQIPDQETADFIHDRLEFVLNPGLQRACRTIDKINRKDYTGKLCILSMEPVNKRSIYGWNETGALERMYRITMEKPGLVKKARDCLEKANAAVLPNGRSVRTFEANVPFELRYMVDHEMWGCQWLRLKRGTYGRPKRNKSTSQYEIVLNPKARPECIPVSERGDIAPMRVLSFDIEAKAAAVGRFVKPERDPVVCVCLALKELGKPGFAHRAIFGYVPPGKSADIVDGASMYLYESEADMMIALRQYILETDPDIFTGWNTRGFDWPYLVKRAVKLGIQHEFMHFSRIWEEEVTLQERVFQSKAYGSKRENELVCQGRMEHDGLVWMLRGQMDKYRHYTLNYISELILGDTKADVPYTEIPRLHMGSDKDRARLFYYCLKDAELPLLILEKRMAFVSGVEQARVTGIPLSWLLSRGQGIKTFSNILRYKHEEEAIPSKVRVTGDTQTKGGKVEKPIVGFYKTPICTLDFNSLYPSIMQAYNICYSTAVRCSRARQLISQNRFTSNDFHWVPGRTLDEDYCFVKQHIKEGILPRLLVLLLRQRKEVQAMMKTEQDKTKRDVLNNRQLALKVVCNSVYGFLKAYILVFSFLMEAVTAYGRHMITLVSTIVTREFKDNAIVDRKACEELELDYEDPDKGKLPMMHYSARIIYGDTDSVMIDFGDIGLQDIVFLAKEAAKLCNAEMDKPNNLDPESVKIRSCFMAPKRYCSLEIETKYIEAHWKLADALAFVKKPTFKGLESKRRDNCAISSETQAQLIVLLLQHNDIGAAKTLIKETIKSILTNTLDWSKYVISKGLTKTKREYDKGGTKQPHTVLWGKIARRAAKTGEVVPETGDRVAYVVTAGPAKIKVSARAEVPIVALLQRMQLDTHFYIYKQLMMAVIKLLTCYWEPEKLKDIKSNLSTTKLLEFKTYKTLFDPRKQHFLTSKRVGMIEKASGIMNHVQVLPQCAHPDCRVMLKSSDRSNLVCDEHSREDAKGLLEEQKMMLDARNAAAWGRCRQCAKGDFDETTCCNVTCDNFYHRQQTIIDVEDLGKQLGRFEIAERPSRKEERKRVVIDKIADAGGEEAYRELLKEKRRSKMRSGRRKMGEDGTQRKIGEVWEKEGRKRKEVGEVAPHRLPTGWKVVMRIKRTSSTQRDE